jgi:hypothetical protein
MISENHPEIRFLVDAGSGSGHGFGSHPNLDGDDSCSETIQDITSSFLMTAVYLLRVAIVVSTVIIVFLAVALILFFVFFLGRLASKTEIHNYRVIRRV